MLTQNQIYTALITDYTAQRARGGPHRGLCRFCTQRHCRGALRHSDHQGRQNLGGWANLQDPGGFPAPGKPGLPPEQAFAVAVPFSTWTTRRSAA